MKKAVALAAVVLSLGLTAALDAQAKRLGGARSSGMQRSQATQPATPPTAQPGAPGAATTQASPAAAAAAAPAAAAAATKRSWAGPLTGLAAGLGLAALASHFGFGEALANAMLIALAVFAVLAIIGFVMRKRAAGGASPAVAGAGAGTMRSGSFGGGSFRRRSGSTRIGSALGQQAVTPVPAATAVPVDFDAAGFARNAKAQFLALQEANDVRDLDRLRDYLTPEMFEVVRDEIASRADEPQRTEVFGLDARVLEVAEEPQRHVVSVRFTGGVREHGGGVEDLDEIWHLAKPRSGSGGWVIAGIQQVERPS